MANNFYYKSEPNLLDTTMGSSSGVGSIDREFPSVFDPPGDAGKKKFSAAYAGKKTPKTSRSLSSGSLLTSTPQKPTYHSHYAGADVDSKAKFSTAYVGGAPKKPKSSVPNGLSREIQFSSNYAGDPDIPQQYILDTYRPEGAEIESKPKERLRAEKIVKLLVAMEWICAAYIFLSALSCALITYYRKEPWLYSDVCIRGSGLWVGAICLINAFVGISVLCRNTSKTLMFVYMTTSVIAALISGVEVIMSAYSTWRVATDKSNLPGNYGGDNDPLHIVDTNLVVNSVVCLAAFCSAAMCCASVSLMCCSTGCCCEQSAKLNRVEDEIVPQPYGQQQVILHYVVPNSNSSMEQNHYGAQINPTYTIQGYH